MSNNGGLRRLVDAQTVADSLGLDASTIRKWARLGKIPCYYLGRAVRFDPSEVEETLRAHYSPAREA